MYWGCGIRTSTGGKAFQSSGLAIKNLDIPWRKVEGKTRRSRLDHQTAGEKIEEQQEEIIHPPIPQLTTTTATITMLVMAVGVGKGEWGNRLSSTQDKLPQLTVVMMAMS